MSSIHRRLESAFARLAALIARRRFSALGLAALIFAGTVAPLSSLRLETSLVNMFHQDDPARVAYEAFQEEFGKDDLLLILLRPPDVFEPGFLRELKTLHHRLEEEVPHLARITSLVNVRRTRGEDGQLLVEDLMPAAPEGKAATAALKKLALADPLYRRFLVSADGRATALVLEPDAFRDDAAGKRVAVDTPEFIKMLAAAREIVAPLKARGVEAHFAGSPVLTAVLQGAIEQDMRRLMPLSGLILIIFLGALFRKITGVVYPVVIVVCSLLSSFGVMALLGIPVTNVTTILPTFIMVVGVADAVHILAIFYRQYGKHGNRRLALQEALGHAGLAVLLTSLTTAAGLLSFATAEVAWVADFGMAAPIGVGFALLYTVLLLPALLSALPVKRPRTPADDRRPRVDRLLLRIGALATGRPLLVVAVWAIVLVVSAAGVTRLRLSQNGMNWFPKGHHLRVATTAIDQELGGSLTFEVVLDSGRKDGVYNADLMKQLAKSVEELETYQRGHISVGKAMALSTVLKEIHRAINDNDPDQYRVADTNAAIAQELLLFEMSGSDDLEEMVTADLRKARLTLFVPFTDAIHYVGVFDDLKAHFAARYPGVKVSITGMQALFIQTVNHILTSVARSYPVALAVVTLLMVLLLGRIRLGLLAMAPNLVPIAMVAGWMGWLGIPFDFSNMLVGSLAIGLVVDDTIHFLHTFGRERDRTADMSEALQRTLLSTGRAIFITSMTLAAGFFTYMTATLKNLYHFGLLAGAIVLVAMAADFLLVPALLQLARPRKA